MAWHQTCDKPLPNQLWPWCQMPYGITGLQWVKQVSERHVVYDPPMAWWRHQMETFSALLALYAGNSPVTGEFFSQRPVTRSFDVPFDLRLNKWLGKQSWGWWFETPPGPLWHHHNEWVEQVSEWHVVPQVKRRQSQSYKFKEFGKISNFETNITSDTPSEVAW